MPKEMASHPGLSKSQISCRKYVRGSNPDRNYRLRSWFCRLVPQYLETKHNPLPFPLLCIKIYEK